jgi:tricorn protease
VLAAGAAPVAAETLMVGDPALSANNLAFTYAGDIWIANRDGANPHRLTSTPADEKEPHFSPDGSMIAYSANVDGNYDIFVIPAAGGQPRRLTWHPGTDRVAGWSADGRSVSLVSTRERNEGRSGQLFHVALSGGLPVKDSEARVFAGAWNPEGTRFAAVPFGPAYNGLFGGTSGWRGYRGGDSPPLQIIDFAGNTVETVGDPRTTNLDPMWMDGKLYVLSDREGGTFNVYRYDPATKAIDRLTGETEWDVRSAAAQGGQIVYEAGNRLHLLDVASGATRPLPVTLAADLPERQPGWQQVSDQMEEAHISPSGARVAVTARGEVFTVPTDQGAVRNISNTQGARDYSGIWSPDGTRLAYVEDDAGKQTLVIEDQSGTRPVRRLPLDGNYNQLLAWGGKGSHLVYTNDRLELHAIDAASGASSLIATARRRQMGYGQQFESAISPDGRWLAYTNEGGNFNAALYLYQFATGRSYPVSGDFADVGSPVFSRDGKLLFFTASTNTGPAQVGLDMSTQQQPLRAGIYAAVLERGGKSPIAPVLANEGDEETATADADSDDKPAKKGKAAVDTAVPVAVDPTDLMHRVVALPVGEANYGDLATGKDGALYFVRQVQPGIATASNDAELAAGSELMRFDFDKREASTLASGIVGLEINAAGDKLLLVKPGNHLAVADAGEKIDPDPLDLSGVRMLVDPGVEWPQMFDDAWRMEKDYFYDPNMHGIDWDAVHAKYAPFVPYLGRREDLNTLIVEMIAELGVGHNRAGGGDVYDGSNARPGLLGADLAIENGRYRIKRIYDGEQWNPFLKAPLAAPGVAAHEGDYILAVGGKPLSGADNIYQLLSGSAGSQVQLTLASDAAGANRRDVIVEPIADDSQQRLWGWIEDNRRKVDQATGGRVAYVYMPNTADAGFTFFNRMFFAQSDKAALILDDRGNGGGQAANYVIDVLGRSRLAGWKDRVGLIFDTPGGAIYGPKVMLIDQDAGSGGDFMPWAFQSRGLGKLIGTRTWGGLIGISANPPLVDGGGVTVPYFRAFGPDGHWIIENTGAVPDIPVALDQMALEQGRDTQLDAAIAEVLAELAANPQPDPNYAPAYPTERGK